MAFVSMHGLDLSFMKKWCAICDETPCVSPQDCIDHREWLAKRRRPGVCADSTPRGLYPWHSTEHRPITSNAPKASA